MKPLLWIYVVLYALLAVWGIREDLNQRAPPWKALLTTVESALGLGGMWLFITGASDPRISLVWAFVFPFLVLAGVLDARYELRRGLVSESDWRDPQLRSLLWVALLAGLAASIPYYWMNFRVAYGG